MGSRLFQRLVVICLVGYLAISAVAGVFMAEATLHPGRRVLSFGDERQAQEMARLHHSELTEVAIAARDGATLRAWSIRPAAATETL